MIETINSLMTQGFAYVNALTGGNQFAAGVVSAAVMTSIGWLCKDVPRKFWDWTCAQSVTSISVTNVGYERHLFNRIANDISKNGFRSISRTLKVDCDEYYDRERGWVDRSDINVGYGRHYRLFKRWLFMVDRVIFKENQGESIKETITVRVIGRNRQVLHDYIQSLIPKPTKRTRTMKFTGKDGWISDKDVPGNGLMDLALNPEVEELIRRELGNFIDNRDVYKRLGLPYKLSVIMHGLPGSGKTSLIRAIAKEYGFNIGAINMNDITDAYLVTALSDVPPRTIILMEDFDSVSSINCVVNVDEEIELKKKKAREDNPVEKIESLVTSFSSVTRTGFLNALDGVIPLNDVMIVMTTNHIDKIDDAVKRAGRTDLMIDLPPVSPEAIRIHFTRLYPELADSDLEWGVLPGCVINKVKRQALNNAEKCRELLEYYFANPDIAEEEQRGGVERLNELRAFAEEVARRNNEKNAPPSEPAKDECDVVG